MAGILDYQRNVNFAPLQPVSASTPALPPGRGGLFGMFSDDPGAMADPGYSGRAPLTGQQKQSLIFSGISDALDNLQGRDGNLTQQMSGQYAQDYAKQNADKRRAAVNKAIQDAYATGDLGKVRSVILSADPEDVSHIHDALSMTQPKIENFAGTGYSIDPISGKATQVIAPKPRAPLISNGMQSNDNGATWSVIPGYVGQQQAIAGARRAPPKPAAGGPLGNPASLFGRQ